MPQTFRESWERSVWFAKAPEILTSRRAYLKVTDPNIAAELLAWHAQRQEAERAIEGFVRDQFGPSAPPVYYEPDEEGRVAALYFREYLPSSLDGWGARAETNAFEPATADVMIALNRLPRVPRVEEVNDLIGWPRADVAPGTPGTSLDHRDFVRRAGSQTRVVPCNGSVYLSVLGPDAVRGCPAYAQALRDWQPPGFLSPVETWIGGTIERLGERWSG